LLYALDDHVWGIKITALEESADFATLDTEKLFSKLKSHELSRKGHSNHDTSLTSKALITSTRVSGHDTNPTNTISSSLEFALSSLAAAFNEQYKSIPMTRLPHRQESSAPYTSSARKGGDHPGAALSAATPPTSSLITPRRRSLTPPTSMTPTTRATIRRPTASETRRRRSSRRSCPERVLP
jgi:hypothetical protein